MPSCMFHNQSNAKMSAPFTPGTPASDRSSFHDFDSPSRPSSSSSDASTSDDARSFHDFDSPSRAPPANDEGPASPFSDNSSFASSITSSQLDRMLLGEDDSSERGDEEVPTTPNTSKRSSNAPDAPHSPIASDTSSSSESSPEPSRPGLAKMTRTAPFQCPMCRHSEYTQKPNLMPHRESHHGYPRKRTKSDNGFTGLFAKSLLDIVLGRREKMSAPMFWKGYFAFQRGGLLSALKAWKANEKFEL